MMLVFELISTHLNHRTKLHYTLTTDTIPLITIYNLTLLLKFLSNHTLSLL